MTSISCNLSICHPVLIETPALAGSEDVMQYKEYNIGVKLQYTFPSFVGPSNIIRIIVFMFPITWLLWPSTCRKCIYLYMICHAWYDSYNQTGAENYVSLVWITLAWLLWPNKSREFCYHFMFWHSTCSMILYPTGVWIYIHLLCFFMEC